MRLKNAQQFKAVYEARVNRGAGPLVVYTLPNELGHPRLGLSVPRRAGGAVVRNRIKRQLREAFRHLQHDLPRGYDCVINVRRHEPRTTTDYQRLLGSAIKALDEQWSRKRKTTTSRDDLSRHG